MLPYGGHRVVFVEEAPCQLQSFVTLSLIRYAEKRLSDLANVVKYPSAPAQQGMLTNTRPFSSPVSTSCLKLRRNALGRHHRTGL